jgi:hypothetical protein
MATQRRVDGPTPNGGVYSIAYFRNDDGSPADEDDATKVEIVEYDEDDKVVQRTYGTSTGGSNGEAEK